MGLRYEAWTLPWDSGGFKRKIAKVPALEGTGRGSLRFREVAGEGSMDIDISQFARLDDIISDTAGSLIRVYDGTTIVHEWLAERVGRAHDDDSRIVTISGPSLQAAFDKWVLFPWDYPKDPSQFPDWEWGSDGKSNLLRNNEFDSSGESEKQQYHVHGSSGTYTITVPSFGTTTPLSPYEDGGRASDVETALEAIAGITDVSCSGRGHTQYDPMIIEFLDPLLDFGEITIDETNLVHTGCANPPCHNAIISTIRDGSFSIDPWTRVQDPLKGSLNPIMHGTYDSITVVDDPVLGAPDKAIRVDPGQSNAGIQQIVGVTEGAPIFGSAEVYTPSTTDEFFIVILDKSEKFIRKEGPFTVAAANTWETFQLDTVFLDGELLDDEIVFRVQVSAGHDEPDVFHLRNMQLFEGQAAATPGEIINAFMDDATTDHAADPRGTVLTWVDYSTITDLVDSTGANWPENISFNAPFGSTYGQAWDGLTRLGYEWDLTPKTTPSGGLTHDLKWYLKGNGDNAPSTAITVRQGVIGGSVVKRIPDYSAVILEGADGGYHEDTDATAVTNFGRLEKFVASRDTPDDATLVLLGDETLAVEAANRTAVQFQIVATPDHPRPLVDYKPGDSVPMQLPPALQKETRRVQQVDYANTNPTSYQVTGSRVLTGEAGGWDLVRRMWREFKRRDQDTVGGGGGTGLGGVRPPMVIVAASDAPQWVKDGADLICDGIDDHEEINEALFGFQFWSSGDNRVVWLSSGSFYVNTGEVVVGDGDHLMGSGVWATWIRNQDISNSYLIRVNTEGELSDIGFVTSNTNAIAYPQGAFNGTCVSMNYGRIHNVAHLSGHANTFIFWNGTIDVASQIHSSGVYTGECFYFDEGWFSLSNVHLSINGTGIVVDANGSLSIDNISMTLGVPSGIGVTTVHGIVLGSNAGDFAISNATIEFFNSADGTGSVGILSEGFPFQYSVTNAVIMNPDYGIRSTSFDSFSNGVFSGIFIRANVSAIDMNGGNVVIDGLRATDSNLTSSTGIRIYGGKVSLSDFDLTGFDGEGILVESADARISDGRLAGIGQHGIVLDGALVGKVSGVEVEAGVATANTYDAFHLKGLIDTPRIVDNTILGASQLRYGINIAEVGVERAIVVGNDGEDPSDFGTDALNDQGTDTQLVYPADVTYGDNFFRSASSAGAGQVQQVNPIDSFGAGRDREFAQPVIPVLGTQIISVTAASETEAAQPMAIQLAVGSTTETEAAQSVTPVQP